MAPCHRYPSWERTEVVPFIPLSARRVLDAGCSRGGFGRSLRRQREDRVLWGIEPNREAADEARALFDEVVCGYYPQDLPASVEPFDAIVFNDVLEHLVDPWGTLRDTLPLLAPGGVVVASIPNVRHYYVMNKLLLKADFSYTETGVLDSTHLRFFTRGTMRTLFEGSGYEVVTIEALNVTKTWKLSLLRCVAPRFGRDLSTVQYVVVARPRVDGTAAA